MMKRLSCLAMWVGLSFGFSFAPAGADTLTMIVMDPLSKRLSCPCVEGYAQRDYEQLAKYLSQKSGHEIVTVYSESLEAAMEEKTEGRADIVIGKHSVVTSTAIGARRELLPFASLSGKDGSITQTGLIVVRAGDVAQKVEDLEGYRILFGPAECDEKHAAILAMLENAGVSAPKKLETSVACSDGACKVIEWGEDENAAAVISSYAKPLLEGCGTIQKGELRVIGESEPVPFITAFMNASLKPKIRDDLHAALLDTASDKEMRTAMESLLGFIQYDEVAAPAKKKS